MSKYPAWTAAETEYLERLAGEVPFPELVARMQRRAAVMGWPRRSRKALAVRLHRSGERCRARNGQWMTTGGVAELLGCPVDRVSKWMRDATIRAILQPRRIGAFWYIERRSWRRMARDMPRLLGGYSVDALFALLEDRELAESVAFGHHTGRGDYRIRCAETGQQWSSATAAARELHISRAAITSAIRQRRPVAALGLTFEALRYAQQKAPPDGEALNAGRPGSLQDHASVTDEQRRHHERAGNPATHPARLQPWQLSPVEEQHRRVA